MGERWLAKIAARLRFWLVVWLVAFAMLVVLSIAGIWDDEPFDRLVWGIRASTGMVYNASEAVWWVRGIVRGAAVIGPMVIGLWALLLSVYLLFSIPRAFRAALTRAEDLAGAAAHLSDSRSR